MNWFALLAIGLTYAHAADKLSPSQKKTITVISAALASASEADPNANTVAAAANAAAVISNVVNGAPSA